MKSLDFNPFNDLYLEKWYYVTVLEATITHDYYLDSADYEHKWEKELKIRTYQNNSNS